MHDLGTTVVALATPPGRGGIGCVRLSGAGAHGVGRLLFRPASVPSEAPVAPLDRGPRRGRSAAGCAEIRFGRFVARNGAPLDHGYLVLFAAGHSFTGEPTAELWSHGSPAVLAELVAGAVAAGALPAGPGEFTYRALRNGRLDLARAEAVRDLVEARTAYQARVAFAQAEGALSRRLEPVRGDLEECIARAEAAVEFADESETQLPAGRFGRTIEDLRERVAGLLASFRTGRIVRDGASLVLAGLPNVGKSSLFNRLLESDRAIVTEVPGTTRDTLEETLDLDGIPVRLVDTAGLRDGDDPVETEGVRRAERARKEADLVLLVLDGSRPLAPAERRALEPGGLGEGATGVVVLNKSDLPEVAALPAGSAPLAVSARTGAGIERLRAELRRQLTGREAPEEPIVTNARHARALEETRAALERALAAAGSGLSEELVLEDLREAMRHLGEITGELTTDALLDRIFSTFCIGK